MHCDNFEVAHPYKWVFRLPFWMNWNLEMLVFEERGKPEYKGKNLSQQKSPERTNNKLTGLSESFEVDG